jgi:hypothetical protein
MAKARKAPSSGFSSRQAVLDHLAQDPCPDPGACTHDQHTCYAGQWLVHGPHHYTATRQAWRGGGQETIHCAGKTEETRLK